MVTEINDVEFDQMIATNEKVVVKFFADWCGTCKLFAPKYKRLSADEQYLGIKFIEVNAETNPNARKIAGVSNLPFMALFKDGKLLQSAATGKEEAVVELLNKF